MRTDGKFSIVRSLVCSHRLILRLDLMGILATMGANGGLVGNDAATMITIDQCHIINVLY